MHRPDTTQILHPTLEALTRQPEQLPPQLRPSIYVTGKSVSSC